MKTRLSNVANNSTHFLQIHWTGLSTTPLLVLFFIRHPRFLFFSTTHSLPSPPPKKPNSRAKTKSRKFLKFPFSEHRKTKPTIHPKIKATSESYNLVRTQKNQQTRILFTLILNQKTMIPYKPRKNQWTWNLFPLILDQKKLSSYINPEKKSPKRTLIVSILKPNTHTRSEKFTNPPHQ